MKCPKCLKGKIIEVESPGCPNICWICDICVYEFDKNEIREMERISDENKNANMD